PADSRTGCDGDPIHTHVPRIAGCGNRICHREGQGVLQPETMKQKPIVSIAVPLHNEEGNVQPLYREIKGVMKGLGLPYEIILVNDGSTDETGAILRRLKKKERFLRVIELQGNFGEAAALSAGFRYFRGDWIINMDGDGQNDPRAIPVFVQKLKEGYRAVTGWRRDRKESYWIRVF